MTASVFVGTLLFAVSAGLATFFAPCAFPLLPGYVGYYIQQVDTKHTLGGVVPALGAAGGALLALSGIGIIGFTLGGAVLSHLTLLEPLVGAGLVVVGVLFLAGLTPDISISLPGRPESGTGFVVFGAVYALAAAGCVIPVFAGVIVQALTLPLSQTIATFAAYAASIAVPLVGVTLLAQAGIETWQNLGRYTGRVQQVAAIGMILAGVGQLYLSVVVLDVL